MNKIELQNFSDESTKTVLNVLSTMIFGQIKVDDIIISEEFALKSSTTGIIDKYYFLGDLVTKFDVLNARLDKSKIDQDVENKITLCADVRNVGEMAGKCAVQVYLHHRSDILPRPIRELKAFQKVLLQPGERRTLKFELNVQQLAAFDPGYREWIAEAGEYIFEIGTSSRDLPVSVKFHLTGHTLYDFGLRSSIKRISASKEAFRILQETFEPYGVTYADFADCLIEDHDIRKFLKKRLSNAGVSKIEIERASDRVKIIIYTAKPGQVIGKGGAEIEKLKIAAQAYNEVGSIKELEQKIAATAATGKEAKQTVRKLENRIKDLAEIIKYAEQYRENKAYNTAYTKSKNPDAYFRNHERQIILYGGARRMLEQAGIPLKDLNIDKMKTEYQALTAQKNELTATYKNCEKEVKSLNLKLENLNQYLGRTEAQKNEQEQPDRNNIPAR